MTDRDRQHGQSDVIRALGDPAAYPHAAPAIEHIQTHISHVFLVGAYAYKVKKALRLPFLDFSSLEQRRFYCEEEVRLNTQLSPGVYLDVPPVRRRTDGSVGIGGRGTIVDWAVRMRRLPRERTLDELLANGFALPSVIQELAKGVAGFHATAPSDAEVVACGAPDALHEAWDQNLLEAREFVGRALAPEDYDILTDFGPAFVRRHTPLLRGRQREGRIREGHGDLRAEHVCVLDKPLPAIDGLPALPAGLYVQDCVEFSRPLRCCDVISDVAFLFMDLESLGQPVLARAFIAAYADTTGDRDAWALLPFYATHRACVRGKVEALKSLEPEVDEAARDHAARRAKQYFRLATRFAWEASGPAVIACCGLSGSGKSALAVQLAEATGYQVVSSDAVRRLSAPKHVLGVQAYGTGQYSPAARSANYAGLLRDVGGTLSSGAAVLVDATFLKRRDRDALGEMAFQHACPLVFVLCHASDASLRRRLDARPDDSPSDARWDTHQDQLREWEPLAPDEPFVPIDTDGDITDARDRALRALWAWRQGRLPVGAMGSTAAAGAATRLLSSR